MELVSHISFFEADVAQVGAGAPFYPGEFEWEYFVNATGRTHHWHPNKTAIKFPNKTPA